MELLIDIAKELPTIAAILFIVLRGLPFLQKINDAHSKIVDDINSRHVQEIERLHALYGAQISAIQTEHANRITGSIDRNRELFDQVLKAVAALEKRAS